MTNRAKAFTLVEILVALMVSSILIAVSAATYTAFRKALAQDQQAAQLAQNGRVALDRMSREIRQTTAIVTDLPDSAADAVHEIEFANGHNSDGRYFKYYVQNSRLMLDTVEYYFAAQPAVLVPWNSVNAGGQLPLRRVTSSVPVAEFVGSISAWGNRPIRLKIETEDNQQTIMLETTLYERNV